MAIGGDLSKRDGILVGVAVLFIGLGVAYWYWPHSAKKTELEELTTRVEVLERRNQQARADLASGGPTQLIAEAQAYGEMFEVLRRLVPQQNEVPSLLEAMSTASRREGLELGGISPLPIIEGPEFDTYRYKIGILGGYHAIARFLTSVGALTRIVTPVDMRLSDREATGNSPLTRRGNAALVQAEFEIRTYVARTTPIGGVTPPPAGQ